MPLEYPGGLEWTVRTSRLRFFWTLSYLYSGEHVPAHPKHDKISKHLFNSINYYIFAIITMFLALFVWFLKFCVYSLKTKQVVCSLLLLWHSQYNSFFQMTKLVPNIEECLDYWASHSCTTIKTALYFKKIILVLEVAMYPFTPTQGQATTHYVNHWSVPKALSLGAPLGLK